MTVENAKVDNAKIVKRIKQTLSSQPQETVTVLSSLLQIEKSFGYIPEESISAVAEFCNKTTNDVWGVVVYYTNFNFQKPGAQTIQVCWGASCHVKGAQQIMARLQKELKIDGEGTSADGKYTLRYNTCLGACGHAPVIAFGHDVSGQVTADDVMTRVRGAAKEAK